MLVHKRKTAGWGDAFLQKSAETRSSNKYKKLPPERAVQ